MQLTKLPTRSVGRPVHFAASAATALLLLAARLCTPQQSQHVPSTCSSEDIHHRCQGVAGAQWRAYNSGSGNASADVMHSPLLTCIRALCGGGAAAAVSVCGSAGGVVQARWGLVYDGTAGPGYANSLDCARLLRAPANMSLSLIFIDWRLDANSDAIALYDPAQRRYIFSNGGLYMPALYTVTAAGGAIRVEFRTDSAHTSRGWTAVWVGERLGCMRRGYALFDPLATHEPAGACRQAVCGAGGAAGTPPMDAATHQVGEFGVSPYTAGLSCGRQLSTAPGQRLQITFTKWDIYDRGDVVTVHDGRNASAPSLGSWSGDDSECHAGRRPCDDLDAPPPLVSTGSNLWFQFTSGAGGNGDGWSASWVVCQNGWPLSLRGCSSPASVSGF
jgi:hypothetical protein